MSKIDCMPKNARRWSLVDVLSTTYPEMRRRRVFCGLLLPFRSQEVDIADDDPMDILDEHFPSTFAQRNGTTTMTVFSEKNTKVVADAIDAIKKVEMLAPGSRSSAFTSIS